MIAPTVTVSFSDLSKHSARVAATVERAQRVHITRRDGEDLYLTTERHDRHREEAADVAVRLLAALLTSDEGVDAVLHALPIAFPWVRHLSAQEKREFAQDLLDATRDITELDVPANLHRILIEWRATARILADPEQAARAMMPLPDEDHGPVSAP
jgi:hypothetical protein